MEYVLRPNLTAALLAFSIAGWTFQPENARADAYSRPIPGGVIRVGNLVKRNIQPYPTALRDFYLSRDFYGITITPDFTEVDVDIELYSYFHSKGSRTKMVEVDPKVDDFIMRQRSELDEAKRFAIVQEFQKYMAKKMYSVPVDGGSSGFTFKWPWIRNSVWPGWNEFLSADMPRRNST